MELSQISHHRGLGFAVQLYYMRYPGIALAVGEGPSPALLQFVAGQIRVAPDTLERVCKAKPDTSRTFTQAADGTATVLACQVDHHPAVRTLVDLVVQTDKGLVLAQALVEYLRLRAFCCSRQT